MQQQQAGLCCSTHKQSCVLATDGISMQARIWPMPLTVTCLTLLSLFARGHNSSTPHLWATGYKQISLCSTEDIPARLLCSMRGKHRATVTLAVSWQDLSAYCPGLSAVCRRCHHPASYRGPFLISMLYLSTHHTYCCVYTLHGGNTICNAAKASSLSHGHADPQVNKVYCSSQCF